MITNNTSSSINKRLADNLSIDEWGAELCGKFNKEFTVAPHKLHEHEKFSRASIIDLLDNIPKDRIQCYTMIADATKTNSVAAVNPDKVSGAELYAAVESGLFWVNVKRLQKFDPAFQQLLDEMFGELVERGASLNGLHEITSDLILTSPGAHTHYHFDREPNSLWHLHGSKKLWVYPSMDFHYASQHHIEAVYAGKTSEYLPYNETLDQGSQSCTLNAGDAVWWETTSPHRVENNEMCISLNCAFKTRASTKRWNIQRANYFMMRKMGNQNPSISEEGTAANVKEIAYRVSNRFLNYKANSNLRAGLATSLAVDVSKPNCIAELATMGRPAFLK